MIEKQLVEPEVWIEYQRRDMSKDNFVSLSFADAIHRHGIMPDGMIVRTRFATKTNESVWE